MVAPRVAACAAPGVATGPSACSIGAAEPLLYMLHAAPKADDQPADRAAIEAGREHAAALLRKLAGGSVDAQVTCVCARERESERERASERARERERERESVCVCERERESERERVRERESEREPESEREWVCV